MSNSEFPNSSRWGLSQEEVDDLLEACATPQNGAVVVGDELPMTYRRACLAFGNGDLGRGQQAIFMLAKRLEEARRKHPNWAGKGALYAQDAIDGEYCELVRAIAGESPDRQRDEALDVACTAMRFVIGEHA